jgi:hypothetical protein
VNIEKIEYIRRYMIEVNGAYMEEILAHVCRRDRLTCQQCGKSMENVERYLVLHLVQRTRDARLPGDYELNCTRCLISGQYSLCEVVLEHAGGTYVDRSPTRERMLALGKQVLEHSTAHGVGVVESIDVMLAETCDAGDRKILEMMRTQMTRERQ